MPNSKVKHENRRVTRFVYQLARPLPVQETYSCYGKCLIVSARRNRDDSKRDRIECTVDGKQECIFISCTRLRRTKRRRRLTIVDQIIKLSRDPADFTREIMRQGVTRYVTRRNFSDCVCRVVFCTERITCATQPQPRLYPALCCWKANTDHI